jgi:hypothetical protein
MVPLITQLQPAGDIFAAINYLPLQTLAMIHRKPAKMSTFFTFFLRIWLMKNHNTMINITCPYWVWKLLCILLIWLGRTFANEAADARC